jgi:hypothetical protein
MCTDFCICPGTPADQWVKDYANLPDDIYDRNNRTKTGYDGEIKFDRLDNTVKKPLFWTYDPATGSSKDNLVELSRDSFVQCIDNVYYTYNKYKEQIDAAKSLPNADYFAL